jgi:hypothetical protein
MSALKAFRDVVVVLWWTWPDLLIAWAERTTDDLNRWTGKNR